MPDHDNGPDNLRPQDGRPNDNRPRMSRGVLSWVLFIGAALLIATTISSLYQQETEITITDFRNLATARSDELIRSPRETRTIKTEAGEIVYSPLTERRGPFVELTLADNRISGKVYPDVQGIPKLPRSGRFVVKYPPLALASEQFLTFLYSNNPKTRIEYSSESTFYVQLLITYVPWILIALFVYFVVIRQFRAGAAGGGMLGSFGRSRHRVSNKELTNITFNDVAGCDEAKEEVGEIVEFLKNPKKFQRLGGRIPRGVLLVGEPGCGKTLLAKAIAGEADVPFFSISGSDFVEMFVGVGASRVRDLFKQAKDNSPCIVFLDEIDAVGRRRSLGFNGGGGHDEREQTLNAILVEMDGFDTSDQVIVIAATNREDVLDPALTRPGRFDRRVYVPLPDIKGRLEILRVHAKKVKLAPGVDLMRLARGTPMFSGAELAAIINEAALIATMANKDAVDMDDLEEARDKVRWGRAFKSRAIDEKEKTLTAYHEAGHAILMHVLPDSEPLHKVSIIPRGQALGVTFQLPEKDRYSMSRRQAYARLMVSFGGRIAEEMFFDDINSGAAMDIQQATQLARRMICDWGMSDKLGPVRYGRDESQPTLLGEAAREYSDQTAELIDQEVKRVIEEAKAQARKELESRRAAVEAVAQALLKYETLDRDDVDRILRGESIDKPNLTDLLKNEAPPPRKPEASARPVPPASLPTLPGAMPQPGMG